MSDFVNDLTASLRQQIDAFEHEIQAQDIGTVIEAGDGIARASGLGGVRAQELVQFANGTMGIAFNLEQDSIGIIIMGDYAEIEQGMAVRGTGRIASVPVGDAMIGRVVNALGQPVDGKGPIAATSTRVIERIAPGVIERKDVFRPVQTGIKALDAMIPIGRGQRELIIGDRQTGKSAVALDTVINQKGQNLFCIYVAIGQKKASVARLLNTLEKHGAMEYTTIVIASADDSAAMQYIAPYAGCALGEEFLETGRDALIVYDDLSKHAWAYRQVSLLLRRPPGREAYPGDVFYLHSRLLERAAQLSDERGGGSLTALPLIETLLGDVSAYIPTNVISITDGQIYLESDLFYAGIRPAVNIGISVSRVGGAAQTKAMRQVAGQLKGDMAAFRELAAFATFGSDLDKATQRQLDRGYRLTEILKQPQYQPMSLENQVIGIYAGTRGFTDQIPVDQMPAWETAFLRFMETSHPEIGRDIAEKKLISPETEERLKEAVRAFNSGWSMQ